MTTLLSKVKTLIEYAKFGMFICKYHNSETGELFFPRAINRYSVGHNAGYQPYATKITGHLKTYGASSCLNANKTVVEIDLPECINVTSNPWSEYGNSTLKVCKLPSLRQVYGATWKNFTALEYLELGSLTNFFNGCLLGCEALTEFYIKEGTYSTLFLQYCPNLTQKSLHSIIENYADMIAVESPPLVWFGAENLAKIDKDHVELLEAKNINYK